MREPEKKTPLKDALPMRGPGGRADKWVLGGRHPLSKCASAGKAAPRAGGSCLEWVVRPRAEVELWKEQL